MKKKHSLLISGLYSCWKSKSCLKMRATIIVLLICVVQGFASDGYSQNTRLSLNLTNTTLKNVLETIENQTSYYFIYEAHNVNVDQKISISADQETVPQILDHLFENTDIAYQISDRRIALTSQPIAGVTQQQKTISGKVTDTNGQPLPGVTIIVKGTTNGTITDSDGNYRLINVPGDAILVFSFVGMRSQELPVAGKSVLNISLEEETVGIEEVVAIGYGTMKKSDLTGSVATVSAEDIRNYAAANVSQLMTGKAAGVYVAANSGQPGDASVIRIRGLGTVNDNNPLYVVDGQPFDNINDLNPSDIEHIEVLKDASACAIYGSRGSNGVILVTTKKGINGKGIVSFDAYIGAKDSYKSLNMCNSEQYYNFITEAYQNSGEYLDPKFKQQYERGYDTDWWDAATQTALTQNYNLSIRKGDEKSRSFFSLGYMDDEGTVITTEFSRMTMKLNNEYDLAPFLSVGVNLGLSRMKSSDTGSMPYFNFILKADPFTPVINPLADPEDPNYDYDKYAPTEWSFDPNPVAILKLNDRNSENFDAFGNIYADLTILSGLTYHLQGNFDKQDNRFKEFKPAYHSIFSEYNLANREDKYRDQSQITNNSSTTWDYVLEQRLNFKKNFNRHLLDAMIAMSYESDESENINAFKTNTPGNDEESRVLDAATDGPQASGGKYKSSILSYLGRLNYSFDNRYLATVNFRADGSSRFSKGNKWGYFPSFSLGWRINNENFFKNLNWTEQISNLKVRVGWGQNGNQRIDNNAPITLIGTNQENQYYFGTGYSQGYGPVNMGNSDIKWETSEQTNIGLDVGLFQNRFSLTMDYYIRKTKDMLLRVPTPSIAGYPNYPWSNAGDVKNKGFEFTVNYQNKIGDFSYSLTANASTYKNKVTSLGNGNSPLYGSVSKTEVGGAMSRFFGYVQKGVFQNQNEIDRYNGPNGEIIQPYAVPGDFKFADLNDNGTIDDGDRTYIGNPHPKLIYGLSINLGYKNFDFSAFFQGTLGNDIYNGTKSLHDPGRQNALADAYTKAWRQEGDKASYPRISTSNNNDNFKASTWYIEDGSFVRLQNVQLGYNLPEFFLQKTNFITSCRFYVSGQNLFTITGYSGMDPEIGSDNPLDMGYDGIRYPSPRTIMVGVNMKF